jgi:hypothetical protein
VAQGEGLEFKPQYYICIHTKRTAIPDINPLVLEVRVAYDTNRNFVSFFWYWGLNLASLLLSRCYTT